MHPVRARQKKHFVPTPLQNAADIIGSLPSVAAATVYTPAASATAAGAAATATVCAASPPASPPAALPLAVSPPPAKPTAAPPPLFAGPYYFLPLFYRCDMPPTGSDVDSRCPGPSSIIKTEVKSAKKQGVVTTEGPVLRFRPDVEDPPPYPW